MRRRVANAIDVHVGKRIKLARLSSGMSQDQLGRALGLTLQQVQLYEKGSTRVGAERLFLLARIFTVPVAYFFEGVTGIVSAASNDESTAIAEALSTPEGVRIARALAQIDDASLRQRIAGLLEAFIRAEERRAAA